MGISAVKSFFHQAAAPAVKADVTPAEIERELATLRLREESCDEYIASTQEELDKRDKRARTFVRLTDFAGNSVKPIAIASLIGMGWNPICALGLGVSIVTLAAAFFCRKKLADQNVLLVKADNELQGLKALKSRLQKEKAPLEKRKIEAEWVIKAYEISKSIKSENARSIRQEEDCVYIGGLRLDRNH